LNPRGCNNVLPRYESDQGGVYAIYPYPGGYSGVQVYCDLNTDGGGWIVSSTKDFFAFSWLGKTKEHQFIQHHMTGISEKDGWFGRLFSGLE